MFIYLFCPFEFLWESGENRIIQTNIWRSYWCVEQMIDVLHQRQMWNIHYPFRLFADSTQICPINTTHINILRFAYGCCSRQCLGTDDRHQCRLEECFLRQTRTYKQHFRTNKLSIFAKIFNAFFAEAWKRIHLNAFNSQVDHELSISLHRAQQWLIKFHCT